MIANATGRPGVRIVTIHGKTPQIADSAFIAPGCTIIGDVTIGADSSVWYNCVLRADVSRIVIGERTNIQDASVLHCDPARPGDPDGSPLLIGDDVLVGHMVMLHGCVIEDRGFVGLGAIAMNKAVIGSDAMLAAGAMLTEGKIMAARDDAIEGLMLKRRDSTYVAGRKTGLWYKWKRDPLLVDCVLMYAQRGSGKRSSFYSDYTFGCWDGDPDDGADLLPVGKAYSGFTDEELKKIDRHVRTHTVNRFGPVRETDRSLVFEVAFDSVHASKRHKSGLAMRFPRIHRVRWDKPVHEADRIEALRALVRD